MNLNYGDDSDFFFPDLDFDHFDLFWDFEIELDSDSDVDVELQLDGKKTPIDNVTSKTSYSLSNGYNGYLDDETEAEDFPF
jgi:hypothetical protein